MKYKMAFNNSRRLILLSALLAVAAAHQSYSAAQAENGFALITDKKGGYQIQINGQTWLANAPSFVTSGGKKYSVADGSLKLASVTQETGEDVLGTWTAQVLLYQAGSLPNKVKFSFKQYSLITAVFFTQEFTDGLNATSTGDANSVCTGFPSFQIAPSQAKLGYMAYGGIMVGDTKMHQGVWGNFSAGVQSGLDSGPLVLFDGKGPTVIISSFTQFMAVSAEYSNSGPSATLNWGILGKATNIPKDFSISTVLFYSSQGVNKGMLEWGKALRTFYGKGTEFMESDFSNNYIGYWTDNGAYYYYLTEKGKTYQQTILDVKTYADKMQIPYRYVQYDSWWYYKGPSNGVSNWVSRPDVFPNGLFYVYNQTGWPVVAHNRWWSHKTVYAKQNGGKYNFIIEEANKRAMPVDQEFWDVLMQDSKKWGLITYEQDWLNTEFDTMDITVSNVTIGRQWLRQMGKGAQKSGITIQYCMSPSRHILESLEIPAVTQARVSNDYHPGLDQWKIGKSSIFAQALGVAPFKDNYWTTTHQPGNPYNATEPFPELNAVVSTLSTGPVGPSDMVGGSNASLIMMSCNSDGLILKPSKPATSIDNNIYETSLSGHLGELWSTYSIISGYMFGIILGADLKGSHQVGSTDAGFGSPFPASVIFSKNKPGMAAFSDKNPVTVADCGKADGQFCLFYTSPVIKFGTHQVVLMGETEKWVPMSPQRFGTIETSSLDIQIKVKGGAGEIVNFSYMMDSKMSQIKCVLSVSGSAAISIASNTCYSL